MEYRYLGGTGIKVSAISLGCEGFMNKRRNEVISELHHAISCVSVTEISLIITL